MYHICHIHSSVDGLLGCFQVLAIANNAAMSTRVHVPFPFFFFFSCTPKSRIPETYGGSIFSFGVFLEKKYDKLVKPPYRHKERKSGYQEGEEGQCQGC